MTGKQRRILMVALGAVVGLGLASKGYGGPGAAWVNNAAGGIPYVVVWMGLVALLRPNWPPRAIALRVLAATVAVEFCQLWQPAWLQTLRATLPGRLVLGSQFTWGDMPYYGVGALVGWAGLGWLRGQSLP